MKNANAHGEAWGALLNKMREEPAWRPGDDPRTIPFLAEAWINSIAFTDLNAETQVNYLRHLAPIVAWSESIGNPNPTFLTQYDVANLLSTYDDRPYEKVQVRSQFKRIMAVAVSLGWRVDNPVLEVKVKAPESQVTLWKEDDVALYSEVAETLNFSSVGGIIRTNWELGNRLRDVCKFRRGIHLDEYGRFRFFSSKTGQYVSVPVSVTLQEHLSSIKGDLLFPNERTGEEYSSSKLTADFIKVRKHVPGADKRHLTLRTLRHSYCVEGFIHGADPYEIASVTGHAFATVHSLMGVYLPTDSSFAATVQELRGFTNPHALPRLDGEVIGRRRQQLEQVRLLRASSPRPPRRNDSFRG